MTPLFCNENISFKVKSVKCQNFFKNRKLCIKNYYYYYYYYTIDVNFYIKNSTVFYFILF